MTAGRCDFERASRLRLSSHVGEIVTSIKTGYPLKGMLPYGTGKTLTDIEKAMDRDTFLEAEEALAFGIVDKVFAHRPKDEESGEASGSGGAPE